MTNRGPFMGLLFFIGTYRKDRKALLLSPCRFETG